MKQKFYRLGALLLAMVLCVSEASAFGSGFRGSKGHSTPGGMGSSSIPEGGTPKGVGIFVSLEYGTEPLRPVLNDTTKEYGYESSGLNSMLNRLYNFPQTARNADSGVFILPSNGYTNWVWDGEGGTPLTDAVTQCVGTRDDWGVESIIKGRAGTNYLKYRHSGMDPSQLSVQYMLDNWGQTAFWYYAGCLARLFPFKDTTYGPSVTMNETAAWWNEIFNSILKDDLTSMSFGGGAATVHPYNGKGLTDSDASGVAAFRYFTIMSFMARFTLAGNERARAEAAVTSAMQAYFSGNEWTPVWIRVEPVSVYYFSHHDKKNMISFPIEMIDYYNSASESMIVAKPGDNVTHELWSAANLQGGAHNPTGSGYFSSFVGCCKNRYKDTHSHGQNISHFNRAGAFEITGIDEAKTLAEFSELCADTTDFSSTWAGYQSPDGIGYFGGTPLPPYADPLGDPNDISIRMGMGVSITPTLVPTTEGSVAYTLDYALKLDLNTTGYIDQGGQPHREGGTWNFSKTVKILMKMAGEEFTTGGLVGYQPGTVQFQANIGMYDGAEVRAEEAEEMVKNSCGYYGSGDPGVSTLTFEHGYYTTGVGTDAKVRNTGRRGTHDLNSIAINGMSMAEFAEYSGISCKIIGDYAIQFSLDDLQKCYKALVGDDLNYITLTWSRDRVESIDIEAEEEKTDWLAGNVFSWFGRAIPYESVTDEETGIKKWKPSPTTTGLTDSVQATGQGGINDPKYAYCVISGSNPEHPTYYTEDQPAYSEFKQGTVTTSGSTSEKFNALTGTVTFTETEVDALKSSDYYYGKDGHYYHFFASGGQEFVVEFDGKFYKNQTATRTFHWTFTPTQCDQPHPAHPPAFCGGHGTDPVVPCSNPCCVCGTPVHTSQHPHIVGSSLDFSITYTGLSYVAIENCRVWQLCQSNLKGTGTLLNQSEVTADIMSTAPGASWNIADMSRPGMTGRMVYDFIPDGVTNGGSDIDNLKWVHPSSNKCGGYDDENAKTAYADVAGGTVGAWCVSDFLVLHTTMGDQSICYHEYYSENPGDAIVEEIVGTGNCGGCTSGHSSGGLAANGIAGGDGQETFEVKEYEEVWKSNGQTSEGFGLEPSGVTYGGYSGNWSNSTRYKSTGQGSNMSDWSSKQAYQNKSKRYGAHSNSNLYIGQNGGTIGTGKVSPVLRLMDDTLVIPDNRVNGRYDFGPSTVFYKNLVDFNCNPVYARGHIIESCPIYSNQRGFTLDTPYSQPSLSAESMFYKQCNSVVIYNPVSNSKAIIISLPKDRDQRTVDHTPANVTLNNSCPGDDSCPYMHVECNVTEHLHNENCYTATAYEVHTGYNAHQHTSACAYHMGIDPSQPPRYEVHHGPSCSHSGETHYSTDPITCSQCGHSTTCGGSTFNPQLVQVKVYDCGDKPKNVHVCVSAGQMVHSGGNNAHVHTASCGGDVNLGTFNYNATGTTAYSFTATSSGSIRFYSTSYNKDPRGRIYINGVCVVDNDDGGGSLNFDTGTIYYNAGDRVVCDVYQYGSTGAGWAVCYIQMNGGNRNCGNRPLNTHICTSECKVSTIGCYTAYKGEFTCNDPHHSWDYNWKLYTYGMQHRSGKICTGRDCTDTSDVKGLGGVWIPLSDFASGALVRHGSGSIHVTATRNGTCSFCKHAYNEVIFDKLYDTSRTNVSETEWTHYPYGDARCWMACNDPKNHNVYPTEINYKGKNYDNAGFINLDWPFTVLFPNEGNFYGTGRKNSGFATAERGYGYTNNMDTTEWTHAKWVIFPFDVVYNGQTFLANERIYLDVPTTEFVFYCPLENYEAANAEVIYGTVAINDPTPFTVDCGKANHTNINQTTCHGKDLAHAEDADKRFYIDVVGRIGALTMEDVGDFRWSNFFKMPVDGWLVPNVVRKVDVTKQNNLLMDTVDVRGVPLTDTNVRIYPDGDPDTSYLKNVAGDTYGNRPERRNLMKIHEFPLTPDLNEQTALKRQPVRIGYDAYLDLETLGNYYGESTLNEDGTYDQTLVWIKPHYYRLSLKDGSYVEADVYVDLNGDKKLINDCLNNSPPNLYYGTETQVNLNWVEELARRNYTGPEVSMTNAVHTKFGLNLPFGSSWVYGNYNVLNLWSRNRTSVGTNMTYEQSTDPSDRIDPIRYGLQGARWHLNLGLPSSSVFVKHGDEPTKKNIDEFKGGDGKDYVIFVALEIYAQGNVWTLAYDGNTINVPFTIIPDPSDPTGNTPGRTYDPVVPYPSGKLEDPTIEMPIVEIISITHSSSEDLDVVGVA